MKRRKSTTAWVMASLAVTSLGACVRGSAENSPTPASTAIRTTNDPSAKLSSDFLVRPLDAYIPTPEEFYLSRKAEEVLITSCMRDFGFDFSYPKRSQDQFIDVFEKTGSRLYGVTDLKTAEKLGYHLEPGTLSLNATSPGGNSPAENETSPAEDFAIDGLKPGQDQSELPEVATTSPGEYQGRAIPPGGCTGAARVKLIGQATIMTQFHFGKDLQLEAFYTARRDSRVLGYFDEWSNCMQEKGYRINDPLGNRDYDVLSSTISKAEIQEAVTDVNCKEKTQLVAKWHKVIVEYENKAIEKNQLALTEEKKKRGEMLARATEVVAQAPQS